MSIHMYNIINSINLDTFTQPQDVGMMKEKGARPEYTRPTLGEGMSIGDRDKGSREKTEGVDGVESIETKEG